MSLLLDQDGQPIIKEGVEPPPPQQKEPEPNWSQIPFPIALFNDKICIKRDDREEMTGGGLILPPGAQERPMTGTVVAVGPGFLKGDGTRMPMPVDVGNRVVFEQFRKMTPIYVQGYLYHILNAHDLLGKVTGDSRIRGGDRRQQGVD